LDGLDPVAILRALDLDPDEREDMTERFIKLSLDHNPGYWLNLIPTAAAAEFRGISEQAMNQERMRGTAPPSCGRGGAGGKLWLYRRIDLLLWAYDATRPCGEIRLPKLGSVDELRSAA